MGQISKTILLETDVAHVLLFHPADLAHAAEWPIAWYSEAFVYPVESAAGRLIAWSTGSDGVFQLRLTDGALSDRERSLAGPAWVFPCRVRHGRIFIDNSDALPGAEQMTQASDQPDLWVDIANGDYAVTVTAIEWSAEPGAQDEGHDHLPNYVIQFQPAGDRVVDPAKRPPDLICLRHATANDQVREYPPVVPEAADLDRLYPAFVAGNLARIGQEFESEGDGPIEAAVPPDGDEFAIFDIPFVAATDLVPGALAVIASCHGARGRPGEVKRYSFRAEHAVEIVAIEAAVENGRISPLKKLGLFRKRLAPVPVGALPGVRVRACPPVEDRLARVDMEALRGEVIADLNGNGVLGQQLAGLARYEALRLGHQRDPLLLADWLIDCLPLSGRGRLSYGLLPANLRCEAVACAYRALSGRIVAPI